MTQNADNLSPDQRLRFMKLQKMHEIGLDKEQEHIYNTICN